MNVRLHASNSTERSMLSVGKEREVGSMRSMITPKAGVCTMGAPLDMSTVQHSSMADPLIQVLLVSILTQRSGELKEAGLAKVGACTHQTVFVFLHLLSSIPPQWLCVTHPWIHLVFSLSTWAGDLILQIEEVWTQRCLHLPLGWLLLLVYITWFPAADHPQTHNWILSLWHPGWLRSRLRKLSS